jgi:hypothetical protein
MAVTKQIQCVQVSATTTSGATPVSLQGVKQVMVRTLSQDIYIDFDQPVAPTTSYRIAAANTSDTTIILSQGLIDNLYVQSVTGSTTVYLIIIAG